jgi:hypothetical protein
VGERLFASAGLYSMELATGLVCSLYIHTHDVS